MSGNHEVKATNRGIELCSEEPCPLIRDVYKKELTGVHEERLRHAEENRLLDPHGSAIEAAEVREELEAARLYSVAECLAIDAR